MTSFEEITRVFSDTYGELCKWDLRRASYDSPIAALTFAVFLKFISDNKDTLKLNYQERYEFGFLSLLYGKELHWRDIETFVEDVELQLGLKNRILSAFASGFELLKMEESFAQILMRIKDIDLKVDRNKEQSLWDALVHLMMVQSAKEIRFHGEAITEVNLAKVMAEVLQLEDGMAVYDFASGYGIALAESARHKSISVFAQDVSSVYAATSIMMLVFAGVKDIDVHCGDSLQHPLTLSEHTPKNFDRVLSTPPVGIGIQKNLASLELDEAFEFGLGNSSKGDLVFAQHAIASIKDDGVAVLQLPLGALFRGGREAKLRRMMLESNYIDSVIELPAGMMSSTSIKTALVVFKKIRTNRDVYFVDLSKSSAGGFFERTGRTGLRITDEGVKEISTLIMSKKVVGGLSAFVPDIQIIDNEVTLTASAYLNLAENNVIEVADIAALKARNSDLLRELIDLETEFDQLFNRL